MDRAVFQPDPASLIAQAPAVEETHISVLLLLGDRAFKLKKPVEMPFIDLRSREARLDLCRREVELNRRICPDVYLGVATVVDDGGVPCDHLVVMRRMPDDRRMSRLVSEGADLQRETEDLARLVASFHARAGRSHATIEAASRDAVARNWADNLATLHAHEAAVLDPAVVARVEALAGRYLAGRGPLFEDRGRSGHAVDGHGDLLADDIYFLDDGPRVLDCLEFSDRLRFVDVLDDVAFLAMDLERLGAPELAAHFLAAYARHSGEEHPSSLAHHYIAYRAGVRSKIACLRADQGVAAVAADARRLLHLAHRHLEAGRVRLVLVGGLPGTGKSTLAARIAVRAGWRLLRSDVVRKELVGVDPSTRLAAGYGEGIYGPEHTAATYRTLLARARDLVTHGESVVVDASWTDPRWREEAIELAQSTWTDLVALRCDAPTEVAARRLGTRPPGEPSDATPSIASSMAARTPPWEDAVTIDTSGTVDDALAAALHALGPVDSAGPADPR
jgi:aminoglycoside phosphotransferase family enzyme/predicted kinase